MLLGSNEGQVAGRERLVANVPLRCRVLSALAGVDDSIALVVVGVTAGHHDRVGPLVVRAADACLNVTVKSCKPEFFAGVKLVSLDIAGKHAEDAGFRHVAKLTGEAGSPTGEGAGRGRGRPPGRVRRCRGELGPAPPGGAGGEGL